MYTRLTKTITITKDQESRDVVSCINFGTERCRIHNGTPDCCHCPLMGAILNQLFEFENMMEDCQNTHSDKPAEE